MKQIALSEESLLLASHWLAYKDLKAAEKNLEAELQRMLRLLEPELTAQPWWSDEWRFRTTSQAGQIYITRRGWKTESIGDTLWIGVENVLADNLFGAGTPPNLYVWLYGKHRAIASAIGDYILEQGLMAGDEVTTTVGGPGYYVIIRPLPQWEPDHIASELRQSVVEFFGHYARALEQFDDTLQRILSE